MNELAPWLRWSPALCTTVIGIGVVLRAPLFSLRSGRAQLPDDSGSAIQHQAELENAFSSNVCGRLDCGDAQWDGQLSVAPEVSKA